MSAKKNILLFRGENSIKMRETLREWREKFLIKHGEMNLLEVRDDTMFDSVLSDALTPGFMGGTRMIIFHEYLIKSQKEKDKIAETEKINETIDINEVLDGKKKISLDNDALWINMLEKIPDTNFILFVGNKKPVTDLEKWLEKNATLHEFAGISPGEIALYAMNELHLSRDQSRAFCERLGFYEEEKWGKFITIGKPDNIYQEIKKLKLAGKTSWTNQELDAILPDYRDENAFNMLDPLWEKNGRAMATIWGRLMATADHELSMAMMITMIRKILIAAVYPDIGDIPITNGQRNTGRQLRGQKKSIKKLYDSIVEVDIAEKSGELPHKTNAFLMALLSFCA